MQRQGQLLPKLMQKLLLELINCEKPLKSPNPGTALKLNYSRSLRRVHG